MAAYFPLVVVKDLFLHVVVMSIEGGEEVVIELIIQGEDEDLIGPGGVEIHPLMGEEGGEG